MRRNQEAIDPYETAPLLHSPPIRERPKPDLTNKRPAWFSSEITLKEIDMPTQTFRVICNLNYFWIENPRDRGIDPFAPGWSIENDTKGKNLPINPDAVFEDYDSVEEVAPPEFDYDEKTNTVHLKLTLNATLTERMELQRFPVDRQFMNVELNVHKDHWYWLTSCPDWMPVNKRHDYAQLVRARLSEAITEYSMESPWVTVNADAAGLEAVVRSTGLAQNEDEDSAGVRIRLRIQRNAMYFLGNVQIPMFIVVLSCLASYEQDYNDVSHRVYYLGNLLLQAVTFQWSTAEMVPPVSYYTFLDYYLIFGFFIIGMYMLEASIVGHLTVAQHARLIDTIIFFGFGGSWILLNVFCLVALTTNIARESWEIMDEQDEEGEQEWNDVQGENLRKKVE